MFHIPKFTQTLLSVDFTNSDLNRQFLHGNSDLLYFSVELAKLFRLMSQRNNYASDPKNMCQYFQDDRGKRIEFGEHRDVYEFLTLMLNQVNKFLKAYQDNFQKIQNINNNLFSYDLNFMTGQFITLDEKITKDINLEKHKKEKCDFESFTIQIESDKSFSELMEESIVTKTEKKSFKQWIITPPKILPVVINRFIMLDNGKYEKNNEHVNIDPEFDISMHLFENCIVATKIKTLADQLKELKKNFHIIKDNVEILDEFYRFDGMEYSKKDKVLNKLNEKASILKAQI